MPEALSDAVAHAVTVNDTRDDADTLLEAEERVDCEDDGVTDTERFGVADPVVVVDDDLVVVVLALNVAHAVLVLDTVEEGDGVRDERSETVAELLADSDGERVTELVSVPVSDAEDESEENEEKLPHAENDGEIVVLAVVERVAVTDAEVEKDPVPQPVAELERELSRLGVCVPDTDSVMPVGLCVGLTVCVRTTVDECTAECEREATTDGVARADAVVERDVAADGETEGVRPPVRVVELDGDAVRFAVAVLLRGAEFVGDALVVEVFETVGLREGELVAEDERDARDREMVGDRVSVPLVDATCVAVKHADGVARTDLEKDGDEVDEARALAETQNEAEVETDDVFEKITELVWRALARVEPDLVVEAVCVRETVEHRDGEAVVDAVFVVLTLLLSVAEKVAVFDVVMLSVLVFVLVAVAERVPVVVVVLLDFIVAEEVVECEAVLEPRAEADVEADARMEKDVRVETD